ncbi:DUF1932 domain-containing protein [Sulfitobacter sp. 1A05707]|uniref:DUF1932 domain-containing protein n=1 Tax=Sulfitobacter sp. 1A05707 TaxID=3368560 RepID=UPI0037470BD7
MAQLQDTDKPALLIVGFGAAGRAYAEGFAPHAHVTASDPYLDPTLKLEDIRLCSDLPETLEGYDLVIVLSPAVASLSICKALAALPGRCPVLDLTSSEPANMEAAAALLGPRFVDGTVLGAVGLTGLATPMVFSGPEAARVAGVLTPLGCAITCLDAPPGAASTLKLLRSMFMKGLEALVVETNLTALKLGQTNGLDLALSDLKEVNILDQMAEMLRTHPRHAQRRKHEIIAAVDLAQSAGVTPVMAQATLSLFERTANSGTGPDRSPQAALEWLSEQLIQSSEVHA